MPIIRREARGRSKLTTKKVVKTQSAKEQRMLAKAMEMSTSISKGAIHTALEISLKLRIPLSQLHSAGIVLTRVEAAKFLIRKGIIENPAAFLSRSTSQKHALLFGDGRRASHNGRTFLSYREVIALARAGGLIRAFKPPTPWKKAGQTPNETAKPETEPKPKPRRTKGRQMTKNDEVA